MARLFYTEAQESTPLYWKLKFNQCVTRIQSSPVFNRTGFILSDRRGMEGLAESRCQEGQMDKLFSQPGGFLHAYQKQKSLKKNWQNKTLLCSQEKHVSLSNLLQNSIASRHKIYGVTKEAAEQLIAILSGPCHSPSDREFHLVTCSGGSPRGSSL